MEYHSWTLPARPSSLAHQSSGWAASSTDDKTFQSLGPINGLVEGYKARPLFEQSGLPSAQLAQIWRSVDQDQDGRINLQEFVTAMNLIRQARGGSLNNMGNPPTRTLRTSGAPFQSSPALGMSPSLSLATGGVGRGVSLSSLQPGTWVLTPDNRQRYKLMFSTHDKNRSGFIGGEEAKVVFSKSNLDQDTLRRIWSLSDIDQDGRLSSDEFCIAMFLVEKAQKGLAPPISLPPELHPAKNPPPPSSPTVMGFQSFEDKKKENFDQGRNELERRRRALQEEEDKAKEERERKRRAEEERKRQEMLKAEQQRQAELERQRQKALELDRARERALQQAALQREAEMREIERKRKEEWIKKRHSELEEELRRERDSLMSMKHYHQELTEQLTKTELDKRTAMLKLSQQRERCTELSKIVDNLKYTQHGDSAQLLQLASEVKFLRQELSQLEPQRRELYSTLSQVSADTDQQQQATLLERCRKLSGDISNLRLSYSKQSSQVEEANVVVKEKKKRLQALHAELMRLIQFIQQLKSRKRYVELASEDKQKQEEERKKQEELDRRRRAIEEAQRQQEALDEEMRSQQETRESDRKRKEEEEKEEERLRQEEAEKLKTLQDARKKADEALKKQKEFLSKPAPFSFFKPKPKGNQPVTQPSKAEAKSKDADLKKKDADLKKKVAELQQRKKELQKQKQKDEPSSKSSSSALDDLKSINLSSAPTTGQQATPMPIPPPPTAVVYESLEEIQQVHAKKKKFEAPPQTNTRPPVGPKPNLPPKPANLRHSKDTVARPHPRESSRSPTEEPLPLLPKPLPPKAAAPPPTQPSQEIIYEIPQLHDEPHPSEEVPPPLPPPLKAEDVPPPLPPPIRKEEMPLPLLPPPKVEDVPPPLPPPIRKEDVPPPLPPPLKAEDVPSPLPSPLKTEEVPPPLPPPLKIDNVEAIYDFPPDSLRPEPISGLIPNPSPVNTTVEALYDLPPPISSPDPAPMEPFPDPDAFYGNVPDPLTGGVTLPDPLSGGIKHEMSPDSSSDAFYGNVSNPLFSDDTAPTSPLPALTYRAKYSFSATDEEEVSFIQGAIVKAASTHQSAQDGWVKVKHKGTEGWAPLSYLQPIDDRKPSTPDISDQAEVMYAWEGSQSNHLSIAKGDIIRVLQKGEGWWMGEKDDKVGWFPGKYVQPVSLPDNQAPDETTPTATPDQYRANYTFEGQHEGDLPFMEGDIVNVLKKEGEWWLGEANGRKGLFPSTYVTSFSAPDNTLQLSTPKEGAGSRKLVGRVIVGFIAEEENQLGLVPGQLVLVRRQESNGWWEGQLQSRGMQRKCGWFPSNRIELLTQGGSGTPSPLVPPQSPSPTCPSTGGLVLALYTYQSASSDELSFHKGSVISVIGKEEDDWWKGELNGKTGLFPSNYVQALDSLKSSSEASQWSEMVQPDLLDKIPATQRKRQEAIFELIQSEKGYVHSLNLVKEVFFIPMENSAVLNEIERQQVIVNWEELITCNSAFSNALFIRLRTSGTIIRSIGDVLQEHIPKLTPHIRWCSCQLTACTVLQSKSADPSFREYEQICLKDPRTGGLPLSSFLLKPMQRVTKYPLLIGKILEYTPSDDLDYESLLMALQAAEKLCSQVNEGVRQKENVESLEWLQSHVSITLNEKLIFNSQTNFMGSRRLLHWGKFIKVRGNKEILGFLFNDFFLLVRPKALFVTAAQMEPFTDNQFTMYREPFLLDQIQVKKGAVEQYGPSVFNVMLKTDAKKEIPLKAESDLARDKWVKQIMDAILAYVRKQKSSNQLQRSDSRRMTLQNAAIGKLLVTVVEAADLIASADGKSDPFCVVRIGENQEAATPVIKNDLNPHWNYTLPDFLITDPANTTLEITVFDSDLFSPNDFLGCAKVSLQQLRTEFGDTGPWTKRLLLEDVPKGELELRITYRGIRGGPIKR